MLTEEQIAFFNAFGFLTRGFPSLPLSLVPTHLDKPNPTPARYAYAPNSRYIGSRFDTERTAITNRPSGTKSGMTPYEN